MSDQIKSVPDRLSDLGKIYAERNAVYGDNYHHAGKVLSGLFPRGITLKTEEDFNRFYLFIHVLSKVSRYAMCMERGETHADSLDDSAVYSMMLQEYDSLTRKEKP